RYPDAMALAEEVLLDFPSNSQALYVLGEIAFQENRFDAALGYFKKGYQVDPRPFLKLRLAKTLSKMGKNEEALEVLENELLRDPRNIFYLKEKAVVLKKKRL
ncbi:MAG: tetratricopeptide repeat protein, partial [Deltaproteobacteria bacterium]|nr:tetratricopeptide repeat protein [Deltaproteobacteria bacterium]